MPSEGERRQRREQNWFIFCGIMGMAGVYFWTESIPAIFAFSGLAALIGEGVNSINRRLDTLIENINRAR